MNPNQKIKELVEAIELLSEKVESITNVGREEMEALEKAKELIEEKIEEISSLRIKK